MQKMWLCQGTHYLKLSGFSRLKRMWNNQLLRQQQKEKGYTSVFTSQHLLRRATYTFLPVPAFAIASVAKLGSQIACIASSCWRQQISDRETNLSCTSSLPATPKKGGHFHTSLHTPAFPYPRPTCTILAIFHNGKMQEKAFLKSRKIISSLYHRQLLKGRLNR